MQKKSVTPSKTSIDPEWITSDPTGPAPPPPVVPLAHTLPFDQLSWENVQRLCRKLALCSGDVERAHSYGVQGQAQAGIDLLVRLVDGSYEVWQVKRYKSIKPSDVSSAVELFLKHEWKQKSKTFVFAATCNLESTTVVKAIESATQKLALAGIAFNPLDANELSSRLKSLPEIVDDFFGRNWVHAFCPPEATEILRNRLSRFDHADLRRTLKDWFASWISNIDPGLPVTHLDQASRVTAADLPLKFHPAAFRVCGVCMPGWAGCATGWHAEPRRGVA
jgi:hypothetical protein